IFSQIVEYNAGAVGIDQQFHILFTHGQLRTYKTRISGLEPHIAASVFPEQRILALLRISFPCPAHILAVAFVCDLQSGQTADGWEKIRAMHYRRTVYRTGGDAAGPAYQKGTRIPPSYRLHFRPRNGSALPGG